MPEERGRDGGAHPSPRRGGRERVGGLSGGGRAPGGRVRIRAILSSFAIPIFVVMLQVSFSSYNKQCERYIDVMMRTT